MSSRREGKRKPSESVSSFTLSQYFLYSLCIKIVSFHSLVEVKSDSYGGDEAEDSD